MLINICEICGQEIINKTQYYKRKTCSEECKCKLIIKNSGRKETKIRYIKCPMCGKTFINKRCRIKKTCSKECKYKLLGENAKSGKYVKCNNCNKMVYRTPFEIKTFKNIFCSVDCHSEYKSREYKKNPIILHNIKNARKKWQHLMDTKPEYRSKVYANWHKAMAKNPNNPEQQFINIIKKHNLPYKYNKRGETVINGKIPDFINTDGKKEVVEIFGHLWHSPLWNYKFKGAIKNKGYNETIKHYKKQGYNCIIIWDYELDNENLVLQKMGI